MDGIAIVSADTNSAYEQHPVTLGRAARVNTGNVVPPGYDAVIMMRMSGKQTEITRYGNPQARGSTSARQERTLPSPRW